jgi:hypothetical protein
MQGSSPAAPSLSSRSTARASALYAWNWEAVVGTGALRGLRRNQRYA